MYGSNAYKTYKNNSVTYASKEQLLLMLVDGAVKFAKIARNSMEAKDIKKTHEYLIRVEDIFTELMACLDLSKAGDWGEDLFKLYSFISSQLVKANLKKDINILDETMPLIIEVRDMWYEAYKLSKR
ncbi:flagellar protein FliS [Clostridium acetobutylicum]|uniref:Flagellar secretion chaperone FliS n=1 Tax=Clostridium acetobutylicum (strain ATCC 824 / DSM 792 / JCM 1419 / IAM 19013 / LMG 5710 / NBRC 13948 / NRRL B-527 / VKM B-1787 / 2291 / W) TaxID=272562 RepID=Q97H09_CLOAB|nr:MULTISPECIES: flagellar export chaperone FliS [Clostridium]AAK80163.1 Flagellar protein FliS [Clostridium acetobutylicum ATCC 824]ADZ21257.1 Flagellar protein FliS [Clostridium acetobutylicum EA 2018]AEI33171.1 flagellar protein FliS [Clostridium acetobutylicum DSM 1731]AWV79411.1 flagellar export chaperone FliS [Clostridium acetobutylicum]KHD38349.1 flagellar biosynthesis protein FliS [Clostridium acetobutylicum]